MRTIYALILVASLNVSAFAGPRPPALTDALLDAIRFVESTDDPNVKDGDGIEVDHVQRLPEGNDGQRVREGVSPWVNRRLNDRTDPRQLALERLPQEEHPACHVGDRRVRPNERDRVPAEHARREVGSGRGHEHRKVGGVTARADRADDRGV